MQTVLGVNFGCEIWGGGGEEPGTQEKQGRKFAGKIRWKNSPRNLLAFFPNPLCRARKSPVIRSERNTTDSQRRDMIPVIRTEKNMTDSQRRDMILHIFFNRKLGNFLYTLGRFPC